MRVEGAVHIRRRRGDTRQRTQRGVASGLALGIALIIPLALLLQAMTGFGLLQLVVGQHGPTYSGLAGDSALNAHPPDVAAYAAYLFDVDLGVAYYAKRADEQLPMASCTKIMTALLTAEYGHLDTPVTIGADAAALVAPGNSYMGVSVGERLTARQLLYGLLLPSGNDAAVALADVVAGSEARFVALMNQRAQELGLTHTHFANPHGLSAPDHYTSARDLTMLAAFAMRNPEVSKITSTFHFTIAATAEHKAYDLYNGDDLLPGARAPYPGAIGVKIGFTGEAGYCQAFAVNRRGHLLVGVVLREPGWQIRDADMRTLLDWAYGLREIPPAPAAAPWSFPSPNL